MMGSKGAVSDGDESTGLARVDDSRVQAEQVAALYSRTAGGIVGSTGAALAMCAFYFDRVPTSVVGAWGGCMLVVVVARIWLLRGYRVAPDSRPAAAWRLWSRLGSAINGLGWGLFFPLFHVADAMGMHALQLVVGAGIMAGAVSMLTVDALSGYLFVTLLGVPAALTFASDPTPIHLAFVAMMTLFLVFMWEFIHTNSATYLRMLRLRFGNRDLVGELRAANADTNRLNRDLVAARDEALAAARAKGEFLAVMSHEIRTPINGMLGMSELLLETRLGERQRRFAETVLHSGQTLLALVNDVLDFARIDEGRLELDDSVFSLRELAEDICALFAVPAERRGLELTCAVAADAAGAYRGDCGRLRQVLTNLLSNAIKFTSSGEVGLRVEAEPDGDRVRLCFEVHDTGVGIAPDERDRIFEPFEQASAGTAREYGGTGLGLAISRHLVELMGGTLEVESERARGSSFRFSIALPPAADAGAESGGQPPALHGVRILIVDDNPTNREVLAGALESWGVRCIAAASGDEALARLRQCAANGDAVEVALIDQHMPGMNGTQLVGAIRAENRLDGLRVVLLNSVSDPEHSGEWRIRGIDAHMAKPVRNHELLATLRALCAAPRVEAAVDAAAPADAGKAGSAGRVRGGVMALLAPSISGSGPRVLLAEDNEVNQEVAREMLLSLGCSVDIAVDGREAVRAIARRRYALVLMDCQMPVQDGYAAASEGRNGERAAGHCGATPTHAGPDAATAAARHGSSPSVMFFSSTSIVPRLLLSRGASAHCTDRKQTTPRSLAELGGHADLVALIDDFSQHGN